MKITRIFFLLHGHIKFIAEVKFYSYKQKQIFGITFCTEKIECSSVYGNAGAKYTSILRKREGTGGKGAYAPGRRESLWGCQGGTYCTRKF